MIVENTEAQYKNFTGRNDHWGKMLFELLYHIINEYLPNSIQYSEY